MTDSNHGGFIFLDLTLDTVVDGPNQIWVADITYIAIATGFVYLAAILDAGRSGRSALRLAARSMPEDSNPHQAAA
jgi:transposase InsO family protein